VFQFFYIKVCIYFTVGFSAVAMLAGGTSTYIKRYKNVGLYLKRTPFVVFVGISIFI